jgi:prevent-host-death family protein
VAKTLPTGGYEVGIKELRADLSAWLRRVRKGEEIVVTDHGTPVARVIAYQPRGGLEELYARGLVTPPKFPKGDWVPTPIPAAGPVSDLVIEERRRHR